MLSMYDLKILITMLTPKTFSFLANLIRNLKAYPLKFMNYGSRVQYQTKKIESLQCSIATIWEMLEKFEEGALGSSNDDECIE